MKGMKYLRSLLLETNSSQRLHLNGVDSFRYESSDGVALSVLSLYATCQFRHGISIPLARDLNNSISRFV